MTLSRRGFLLGCGASMVPLVAPRLVFAAEGGASTDVLVLVFQRGGSDGLNLVPPYADPDYYRLRPSLGVPRPGEGTGGALDLDGTFGLHPALAPLLPAWEAGELAVVHATGLRHDSRSHFECQDHLERGSSHLHDVADGWLNRYLQGLSSPTMFEAVGVGQAVPMSLRGAAPVIGLASIAGFGLDTASPRQTEIASTLAAVYGADTLLAATARQALAAVDTLATANPAQFPAEHGASYPETAFGRQLAEVAQLIKAGIGLRVASVDIGGWDHHDQEAAELEPLAGEFAAALAAFRTDLGSRMAGVTVATMTEFGRRAFENGSDGTDHGSGFAMFLMGGGVAGRRVYAEWPGLGDAALYDGALDVTIDYRTVLAELLERRMGGADVSQVFPGFTPGPSTGAFRPR